MPRPALGAFLFGAIVPLAGPTGKLDDSPIAGGQRWFFSYRYNAPEKPRPILKDSTTAQGMASPRGRLEFNYSLYTGSRGGAGAAADVQKFATGCADMILFDTREV
jgi:hypothetical protein